jgi:hypothetical protein
MIIYKVVIHEGDESVRVLFDDIEQAIALQRLLNKGKDFGYVDGERVIVDYNMNVDIRTIDIGEQDDET